MMAASKRVIVRSHAIEPAKPAPYRPRSRTTFLRGQGFSAAKLLRRPKCSKPTQPIRFAQPEFLADRSEEGLADRVDLVE